MAIVRSQKFMNTRDQNIIIINNIFVFRVAICIIRKDKDPQPPNMEECQPISFWTYSPND